MGKTQFKRSGSYVRRYEEMLKSPAYRDLSTAARCLLEEFQRIYRPNRNGRLSIGTRQAAKLLNVAPGTARGLFYDLSEHGFIQQSKPANWQEGMAREWRLTFEPCSGRNPTDDWRQWTPGNPLPAPARPEKKKSRGQNVLRYCVNPLRGTASKCAAVSDLSEFTEL